MTEDKSPSPEDITEFSSAFLGNLFVFCIVWGVGGSITAKSRKEFGDAVWMTFLVLIAGEFTTDVRGPPL